MVSDERIYIGSVDRPSFSFDKDTIESIICNNSVDVIGNELSSDVLEASVFYDDSQGALRGVGYATEIYYYSNGIQVGKYYITKVERTGMEKYLIRATSVIGILEKEDFYGGMYSGDTFKGVVDEILFSDGVSPTYDIYPYGKSNEQGWRIPKTTDRPATYKYFKCGMHVEFDAVSTFYFNTPSNFDYQLSDSFIGAGPSASSYYHIIIESRRDDASSPAYWIVETRYSTHSGFIEKTTIPSDASKLIGDGSSFVVDIRPTLGTVTITCNYKKYDNPSVTGTLTVNGSIPSTSISTTAIDLGYPFSYMSNLPSNHELRLKKYQIYDGDQVVIDTVFAKRSDGSYFCLDKVSGVSSQITKIVEYGDKIGTIGDFSKIHIWEELNNRIHYNEGIDSLLVFGWIPICTKREALHQLLFSENVNMIKDGNGDILFTSLTNNVVGTIDASDTYDRGTEQYLDKAKRISVTEHSYSTYGSESQVIFDNSTSSSAGLSQYFVKFTGAPIYGTPVGDGITILFYNCNAAIVTGRGVITGVPYIHSQNYLQYVDDTLAEGADVSADVGLITSLNSDAVLNKLKAYYSGDIYKTTGGIVYNGERCGLVYGLTNAFGTQINAFLTRYSARTSTFVKADCEFLRGYTPQGAGGYSGYVILTYGEEWEVPSSIRTDPDATIRLNIIGKGYDGTAGSEGEIAGSVTEGSGIRSGGTGGAGGAGGVGGSGGDIYSVTVSAYNRYYFDVFQESYVTGVRSLNSNRSPTAYWRSSSGTATDGGFTNIFTGEIYARKGPDGIAGGKGGDGGYITSTNPMTYFYENGESVNGNSGGLAFEPTIVTKSYEVNYYNSAGGGGASATASGENSARRGYGGYPEYMIPGRGADGGAPLVQYTNYGCGGSGGNGGGGTGGFSALNQYYEDYDTHNWVWYTSQGGTQGQQIRGGRGGPGTSGVNGCVIIYY